MSRNQPIIAVNKKIQALGAERQLVAALSTFRGIKSSGLQPTLVTYNVILYACVRCGALETALQLFADQKAAAEKFPPVYPNVITYTTIIKGLCQAGQIKAAARVLKEMSEADIAPNLRTANMFLRGCLWHGHVDEAMECYHKIPKWGLSPDRTTVDYVVRLLATALRINEAIDVLTVTQKFVKVRSGMACMPVMADSVGFACCRGSVFAVICVQRCVRSY